MNLKVIYDPILRRSVKEVTVFDVALKKEADEMLETMKNHNGIGLAANQVGINKRLIVLGYERQDEKDEMPNIPFTQICNPKVVKFSKEKDTDIEGCLSIPGLELPVERSAGVVVEALDLSGKKITIKAKGLHARVLQHEIDHINGILFTDRVKNYRKLSDYSFARIVFIGSDDFSLIHLKTLVEAGLNVVAVVTETDKRSGRGNELKESLIKTYCKEVGIAVFQPEDSAELTEIVKKINPSLLVLASYGRILPEELLEIPTYGSINVHPSLLPKYRGATPIQTAILNGDKETGVTIMEMVKEVDAGKIILQKNTPINDGETSSKLRARLAKLGSKMLLEAVPLYLSGQAKLIEQDSSQKSLTKRFLKTDGEINWTEPTEKIVRKINAFEPWPGTYTFLAGKRLKIIEAELREDKILPTTVQLEGKNPTNWKDFVKGYQNQLTQEPWSGKITW